MLSISRLSAGEYISPNMAKSVPQFGTLFSETCREVSPRHSDIDSDAESAALG